jgi:hypothetical protein
MVGLPLTLMEVGAVEFEASTQVGSLTVVLPAISRFGGGFDCGRARATMQTGPPAWIRATPRTLICGLAARKRAERGER